MITRKARSGVVLLSSTAGLVPSPLNATYHATQAFVRYLALAVNEEVKEKKARVDVMSLTPGLTTSTLTQFKNEKFKSLSTPTDQTVKACLRDIGYEKESCGSLRHDIVAAV